VARLSSFKLLVEISCVLFSFPAFSADCSEVLKYGIWETYNNESYDQTDQSFASNMCSRSHKNESGGITIAGYGSINAGQDSSEDICRNEQSSLKINRGYADAMMKASPEIVESWLRCMDAQGSHASIIHGHNLGRFSIELRRNLTKDNYEIATITINPAVSCLPKENIVSFYGDKIIGGCERTPTEETSVTVNFEYGPDQQLYIPAVPKPTSTRIPTEPKVTGVQVPVDSSDGVSWSRNQNIWNTTFPIRDVNQIGIGYIVEPEPFHRNWGPTDVVIHDHQYKAAQVPDPTRAIITYEFSEPAKISEMLVIQHTNGIAQIGGWIGNDRAHMHSLGIANSSLGSDLPPKNRTFVEGYRDVFKFERSGKGRVFAMTITKTTLPNGYALYRAYPRNENHKPYEVMQTEQPSVARQ
jgi:hypothetical protein